MPNKLRISILIILLGVGILLYLRLKRPTPIDVTTEKVGRQQLELAVNASGRLTSVSEEVVEAPLTGTITEILIENQSQVEKDQVLFKYDRMPFLIVRDQAKATLEASKLAKQNLERNSPLAQEKIAVQALVDQTKNTLDDAQDKYDQDASDVNRSAVDTAKTAYENAKAQLERLKRQDPTQLAIDQAAASVHATEEAYLHARINLGQATVKAPVSGRIYFQPLGTGATLFSVEKGMTLTQGQPLFVIRSGGLQFQAGVDESDIRYINTTLPARVDLDAYPEQTFTGEVVYVSAEAHLDTNGERVFLVKINLDDAPSNLRFNVSGSTDIIYQTTAELLVIPFEALQQQDSETFVYLVNGERVQKKKIEAGEEINGWLQVKSGLHEGDIVVTNQPSGLRDGSRVQVTKGQTKT